MQYAICRHAISLNIILVKPTKCTLSKMHKMHIGILARMPFLAQVCRASLGAFLVSWPLRDSS